MQDFCLYCSVCTVVLQFQVKYPNSSSTTDNISAMFSADSTHVSMKMFIIFGLEGEVSGQNVISEAFFHFAKE